MDSNKVPPSPAFNGELDGKTMDDQMRATMWLVDQKFSMSTEGLLTNLGGDSLADLPLPRFLFRFAADYHDPLTGQPENTAHKCSISPKQEANLWEVLSKAKARAAALDSAPPEPSPEGKVKGKVQGKGPEAA